MRNSSIFVPTMGLHYHRCPVRTSILIGSKKMTLTCDHYLVEVGRQREEYETTAIIYDDRSTNTLVFRPTASLYLGPKEIVCPSLEDDMTGYQWQKIESVKTEEVPLEMRLSSQGYANLQDDFCTKKVRKLGTLH